MKKKIVSEIRIKLDIPSPIILKIRNLVIEAKNFKLKDTTGKRRYIKVRRKK